MSQIEDITGQRFNELTAIEYAYPNKDGRAVWKCQCDCGNITYVTAKNLKSGNTKSCGCRKMRNIKALKYKDGRCSERLYRVWLGMKARCNNVGNIGYRYYGAKGIKVCDEWENDYASFRTWAFENGYDPNAPRGECTIDRIDSKGDYCPENCRWVSMDIQHKNQYYRSPKRDQKTGRFLPENRRTGVLRVSLDDMAFAPCRQHVSDVGIDLKAKEDQVVPARGYAIFDTGVHIELQENTAGLLVSRSGLLMNHDITSEGLIDPKYTGSIRVKLINHGDKDYKVKAGERITQLLIVPFVNEPVEIVGSIKEEEERGDNGFGSTGIF